jgi:superfamily I DNA/RNA helicase
MDETIIIPEYKIDDKNDYLIILESLKKIPFGVGKNLLIDFLAGNKNNPSIKNNSLNLLKNFGGIDKNKHDLRLIIDDLINKSYIEISTSNNNKFMKLLKLTQKGLNEINNPQYHNKKQINNFNKTIITEDDKLIFKELNSFLEKFNDDQKMAIISDKQKILCVAGAGSGKTTVLTKRIEFLINYRGTVPDKILAITFTRKAKEEMQERLIKLRVNVHVETFNSFCEKILLNHGDKIYSKPVRMIDYKNKMMIVFFSLSRLGLNINSIVNRYFSAVQKRNKTFEELSNIFISDCFFILDYFKSKNKELYDFSTDAETKDKETAKIVFEICKLIKQNMNLQGLRDYSDQIIDTVNFFKKNKSFIPEFNHILVDEYQDVNSLQINLLDLLNAKNLFCVGDPRQSIFGWRGSKISYILNFKEKYPDSEIITLNKNYRSNNHLVALINTSVKEMEMPNLEPTIKSKKEINLFSFNNENQEYNFIMQTIIKSDIPREEIFVLSRTNLQLKELAGLMRNFKINFIIKNDDNIRPISAKKGEVTLSTIHSIKGLEAKMVFVIGVTEQNFPCKSSDHPIIEIIKVEDYNKEEEEKRLFYVALSRAKQKLILTYSGKNPSRFINDEILKIINDNNDAADYQMRL